MERLSYKKIGHNETFLYEARQGNKTLQVSILPLEKISIEIILDNKKDTTEDWEDVSHNDIQEGVSKALKYVEDFLG